MGSVVLSLDAELGWGFHDRRELPEAHIRSGHRAWNYLCDTFDRLNIPATWAITGHLFLDSCQSNHRDHPAGRRCCTRGSSSLNSQEIWFASDLIRAVRSTDVDHEIASHGFTHVHFEHERMDEEFAAQEISASIEIAAEQNIELSSFVFPVNRIDHRQLLAESGFTCYRGTTPRNSAGGMIRRRLEKLTSGTVGKPTPPVIEPRVDEYGLVNIPASLYLFSFEGIARSVLASLHRDPVVEQAISGIDKATETDGVFHLWFHPHNLRTSRDFERLETILAYLNRRQREDGLRIETMADVAERVTSHTSGTSDSETATLTNETTGRNQHSSGESAFQRRG
ncbi:MULTISPECIES: DUF2334 domain-containing protein [unclassified Haladaptatus]|uniref:polysaccharide deacetylase family protein n=1 Tax=unclassified Haladaptatus TaxID=2622732 RepID=UPI00209C588E|nr:MULTISPECIES: DUF2334 domain-containing protein [unclassified Haladaptatus]MCO8244849.1 DUF2334 domain-containing protein [Haladaptatus sp. AB643]MCO8255637.1 DUF2334 domain-containing protein [Haladaptatus sp. AB618]